MLLVIFKSKWSITTSLGNSPFSSNLSLYKGTPCRDPILILLSGKRTFSTLFKIFHWISLWRHLWRSHISSTLINSTPRKTVSLKFLATFKIIMHECIRKIKKNSFIFAGGRDQKLIDALTSLRIQTVLLTRLFNPLRKLN